MNDEYVFIKVEVPYATVKTAKETGEVNDAAKTQLFNWDVNDGWIEVESDYEEIMNNDEAAAKGVVTYVYAYATGDATTGAMTALSKDAETPALFNYVRFANIVEDEGLEETDLDIVVSGYGIQVSNLNDGDSDIDGNNTDGKTIPADVWSIIVNADPDTAVDATEDAKTDIKATTPAADSGEESAG